MKVICPHTTLHPVTKMVLDSYNLGVQYVPLYGTDGYRQLLQQLWQEQEDVVIIEHDIVPWPGCIEELYNCPGEWCTNSYHWQGKVGLYHMLGCTKISVALMRSLPDVWAQPGDWSLCDRRLFFAAQALGKDPHQHRPPVIHLKGPQCT
jgi:hypothetical protein